MNILLYVAVVLIWGTTWIGIAVQSHYATPVVAILWRFAISALLLWVVLLFSGKLQRIALKDHLFCMLQGLCVFGLNFICFYTAVKYVNSGLESVIFSMAVFFNAINALIFFKQKPSPNFAPAALLGLSGIVLLFWHDLINSQFNAQLLMGIGLCAIGTYGFSLGNMISVRHQKRGLNIFSTNCYAMTYGALVMLILALFTGQDLMPPMNFPFLSSVLYLAVFGTVIGFSAYFSLVGRIGAAKAAYSTLLFPLVALTVSTFFEGYEWTLNAVFGILLILLGNYLMFSRFEIGKKLFSSQKNCEKQA
ncbi:EamA family transporter [Acinetobacter baumannii]|uniref:DMT family transporter n=1 Tax=Acinetobacter baumannii TaxID=470 RepID=UPI0023404A58|nr:EamA family transporter [Acinetobacter baumannii]MDC4862940.1 DMT family transporter [Acinetobacter baumannii]MDH2543770.1 EamA family transporter [Acinetobacter baumannii]MDV5202820.1 EamA family transporter [Acinetobacter baumannii]MDV5210781.1 EamA family transporter [Acinetobacter baumannii]MDV5261926.1 EamA family transporter [Acinetobacter baumannii]